MNSFVAGRYAPGPGEPSLDELATYVGMMVNPDLVKRQANSAGLRKRHKEFYDCLYKYSHKKLKKLMKDECLVFLFRHFVSNGDYQRFKAEDDTLSKTPGIFDDAMDYFLRLAQ